MATSNSSSIPAAGPRSQMMTGDLPEGFLQLDDNPPTMLPPQYTATSVQQHVIMNTVKRLSITVVQAKLAKNYGLTRMDPYCRLRIGHHVFETTTANNGSINPRWNKTVSCPMMEGTNTIYVEIFDECAFSTDVQIAWGLVKISDAVWSGEMVDDWYPLNGKQGDEKEGMVNIIMSCNEVTEPAPPAQVMIIPQAYTLPQVYYPPVPYGMPQQMPPGRPMATGPAPQAQPRPIRPEDVENVKAMFPDLDEEVIRSVLEASGGNVDAALNHLLSMNEK